MKYNKEFWHLYSYSFTFGMAVMIAGSVFLPFLIQSGFTFYDLFIYTFTWCLTPLLVLPFLSSLPTKKFMTINFLLRLTFPILIWNFYFPKTQLILLGITNGIAIILNPVSYNARFFVLSKNKKAELSSVYFSVGPILGIFLPAFGGWITQTYSYRVAVLITTFLLIIPFIFVLKFKEKIVKVNLRKSFSYINGLRTVLFLEGFWETIPFFLVGTWILFFLREPLQYGAYGSYLALIGVVASFVVAKISDKIKRRAFIIYPITIFLAIATFLLGFSSSLAVLSLLMIFMTFAQTFAWPFMVTVYLDNAKDVRKGLFAREFMLNLGRVCSISLLIAIYYFTQNLLYGFFVLGIAYLLYPLALWKKNHYR